MPERRKGAPGSFGAPLDELLPKLGAEHRSRPQVKVDIHRKPAKREQEGPSGECRIFLLNQSLYERSTR